MAGVSWHLVLIQFTGGNVANLHEKLLKMFALTEKLGDLTMLILGHNTFALNQKNVNTQFSY